MIEMKVDSSNAVRLFEQLAARTQDTRPAMVAIAGIMRASVEENFEVQGRPRWSSLSKARIRERTRKGTWPGKILTEFGQLAASMSTRATLDTAVVGTNVKYAAAQFLGLPEKNIPARNALVLQEKDMGDAETVLLRHLLR